MIDDALEIDAALVAAVLNSNNDEFHFFLKKTITIRLRYRVLRKQCRLATQHRKLIQYISLFFDKSNMNFAFIFLKKVNRCDWLARQRY